MLSEHSSEDHYFSSTPVVDSAPTRVDLLLPDLSLQLRADRGIFSQGSIDTGTRFLLMEAPTPEPHLQHVLDLGCGYGPIALTLAHRTSDAAVWAVDINTRAVELCATNAEDAGFDRVRAVEPDETGFTWWDYRAGHFHKGFGLRIDLALLSDPVAASLETAQVDRDYRKPTKVRESKASDHAPLIVDVGLG